MLHLKNRLVLLALSSITLSACSSPSLEIQELEAIEETVEVSTSIVWENLNISEQIGVSVQNITDLIYTQAGTIVGCLYDEKGSSYIVRSEDLGETWTKHPLDKGISNPRAIFQASDGILYFGTSVSSRISPFWSSSDDGKTWDSLGSNVLPNPQAQAVWDILELSSGKILLATDSLMNDPEKENPAIYEWDGETLSELAQLPGLGVTRLAIDAGGTIYAATQESIEHDDPSMAGQGRVFRSSDEGKTWEETGLMNGANRIYSLLVLSDGSTLMAGTGISGELYRSTDRGDTWEKLPHTPQGIKIANENKPEAKGEVTRIYSILETEDGLILVGTGNSVGEVFQLDKMDAWTLTKKDHQSIVVWSLLQTPDGTIWAGTGSYGGDVLKLTP